MPRNSVVALIVFGVIFKFLTKVTPKYNFLSRHLNKFRILILFLIGVSLFSIGYSFYKYLRSAKNILKPEIP